MPLIDRRSFLAASAATVAAAPASAAQVPGEVDIAIIGAGAAGIAAARRIATTRARFVVLEAAARVGGRCFTDTTTFSQPYDRGAHWIHVPEINPVVAPAVKAGLEVYPAPPGQRVRIGRRNAREGEMEDYLTAVVRANRAIADSGGRLDSPAAQLLPKDLGTWQRTVEFVLGPFACGRDLTEVSAADLARGADRAGDAFCRQGFGALLVKLAEGLPVQLSNPASRIEWGGRSGVDIDTAQGRLSAQAAIVTVSTGVLMSDRLKFVPELPRRQTGALDKLKLGSFDHIALELPGNPLGLGSDELAFEKADSERTAAVLANVSGTALTLVMVGGKFGRDLAAGGDGAMVRFALDWLSNLYGPEVKKAVKRSHATAWNNDPWTRGAFSVAAPGGQSARAVLAEPLRERLFIAGEATDETLWGTVGGAWASGERAAEAALKRTGFLMELQEPKRPQPTPAARRRSGAP
jgi:monoamine oxidase